MSDACLCWTWSDVRFAGSGLHIMTKLFDLGRVVLVLSTMSSTDWCHHVALLPRVYVF